MKRLHYLLSIDGMQCIDCENPIEDACGIYMEVEYNAYRPHDFTLRAGIPVKWIINARNLDSCAKKILLPSLDMTIALKPGLQIIEFTPQQVGSIHWSCSMGMIPGTFRVFEYTSRG